MKAVKIGKDYRIHKKDLQKYYVESVSFHTSTLTLEEMTKITKCPKEKLIRAIEAGKLRATRDYRIPIMNALNFYADNECGLFDEP